MKELNDMKRGNIVTKTIFQIFLYFVELIVIAGGLTFVSCLVFKVSGENETLIIMERFVLFYGVYQLIVVVILNNINDIKADEYLALHTTSEYAILAVETGNKVTLEYTRDTIGHQLGTEKFNDLKVRAYYVSISKAVKNGDLVFLKRISILSEHFYEESRLNWKYSIILRLVK